MNNQLAWRQEEIINRLYNGIDQPSKLLGEVNHKLGTQNMLSVMNTAIQADIAQSNRAIAQATAINAQAAIANAQASLVTARNTGAIAGTLNQIYDGQVLTNDILSHQTSIAIETNEHLGKLSSELGWISMAQQEYLDVAKQQLDITKSSFDLQQKQYFDTKREKAIKHILYEQEKLMDAIERDKDPIASAFTARSIQGLMQKHGFTTKDLTEIDEKQYLDRLLERGSSNIVNLSTDQLVELECFLTAYSMLKLISEVSIELPAPVQKELVLVPDLNAIADPIPEEESITENEGVFDGVPGFGPVRGTRAQAIAKGPPSPPSGPIGKSDFNDLDRLQRAISDAESSIDYADGFARNAKSDLKWLAAILSLASVLLLLVLILPSWLGIIIKGILGILAIGGIAFLIFAARKFFKSRELATFREDGLQTIDQVIREIPNSWEISSRVELKRAHEAWAGYFRKMKRYEQALLEMRQIKERDEMRSLEVEKQRELVRSEIHRCEAINNDIRLENEKTRMLHENERREFIRKKEFVLQKVKSDINEFLCKHQAMQRFFSKV